MKRLSAVLISYNEEARIGRALESLAGLADEILVVDSNSTDRTEEICAKHSVRFVQKEWQGYRDQKQYATDLARNEWIISLDCDETVSPELRTELLDWKNDSTNTTQAFLVPRLTCFMGRWIRHTSWYPDYQLRLFNRGCGRWEGGRVHESFKTDAAQSRLENQIYHVTYSTISEYLHKLDEFSTLSALDNRDRGRRPSHVLLVLQPPIVFLQNYFLKRGFLDGLPGFVVSSFAAISTFFKHLKLIELERNSRHGGGSSK